MKFSFARLAQVAFLASIPALAACGGNFRVVNQTQAGGVLALAGSRDDAHVKAEGYMASRCSGGYDVLEEGEAVIGETSHGTGVHYGFGVSSSSTSTTQKTEWRINFRCKGAAAPADTGAPVATTGAQKSEIQTLRISF